MEQGSRRSIVLASRSPRRLELARGAGWDVTVVEPPEEAEAGEPARGPEEPLERYVLRLARAKAAAVADAGTVGTILACDTLGEIDGVALGKPADREDAQRMLMLLSGRRHRVVSGICLWRCPGSERLEAAVESVLDMESLADELLAWYLDSGLWRGKAGACGFQDARLPLRLVAGSPSNVVGLPLETVTKMLERLDAGASA